MVKVLCVSPRRNGVEARALRSAHGTSKRMSPKGACRRLPTPTVPHVQQGRRPSLARDLRFSERELDDNIMTTPRGLETAIPSRSVSSDQTSLLSSTSSVHLPQSSAPGSAAPSRRASRLESLQVAAIGLGLAPPGGRTDEHVLHASVAVPIQSPGGNRLSTTHHPTGLELILGAHVRHHGQLAVFTRIR